MSDRNDENGQSAADQHLQRLAEAELAEIAKLDAELDDPERKVEEYEGIYFGQKARVLEDDEENGVFEGDEGRIIIEKLGAAEYGNLRTAMFIIIDGMGPVEVEPENLELIG